MIWLHEKQIIYMEKGSYHTLKPITLELGVLEIRHLRCDGFFAVHVCGVSESGQQSKKNLNYIFYWNLITGGRVLVTFLKKIKVKKSGMQR